MNSAYLNDITGTSAPLAAGETITVPIYATNKGGTLKVQGDVLGGGVASGKLSKVSFHTFREMDHIAANSTYLAVYTCSTVHYYNKSAVETLLTNTESLIQKMTIDETHVFFKKSGTEIKKQAIGLPASTTITLSESADGKIFKIIDTHIVLAGTTVAKFYDKSSGVLQKTYTSASLIVSMCSNDTHYFFCRRTSLNNVTIDKVLKTSMSIVASFPVSSSSIATDESQSNMGSVIKDNIIFISDASCTCSNNYAIVALDTTTGLYSEQLLNSGALYYHEGLWIWDYELWIGRYDRYATKNTIEQRSVSLTLTATAGPTIASKTVDDIESILSTSLDCNTFYSRGFNLKLKNNSAFDIEIDNLKVFYDAETAKVLTFNRFTNTMSYVSRNGFLSKSKPTAKTGSFKLIFDNTDYEAVLTLLAQNIVYIDSTRYNVLSVGTISDMGTNKKIVDIEVCYE